MDYSPAQLLRDLKTDPAWQDDDLGMPLPNTQHACSVCLPTWNSVIGYEEGLEKVVNRMLCGYPRFFCHPAVERLFLEVTNAVAENGFRAVVFPTKVAVQRAQRFVEKRTGSALRVVSYEGVQALILPESDYPVAMEYWRYTGEIISSRQAESILQGENPEEFPVQDLRSHLAKLCGNIPEDVFLYENGMSAIYAIHRAIIELSPRKKTLQLEFPYVDALRVQNHFGNGVVFLNHAEGESFEEALHRIKTGEFAAVFCEAPSNPLLRTIDLARVSAACLEGGAPLIIDDTTASSANIQVNTYADIITTSLTKWLSGEGDVMGGQVTLCPNSPLYSEFQIFFTEDCLGGSRMFSADARVLTKNSIGFEKRMKIANTNGEAMADLLANHPAVEELYYPKYTTPELYEQVKRDGEGYGGLMSFVLKNRKKTAKFYDTLKLSKGPSLGTNFTLACPFTLLAHYDDLAWAEGCGLDKHLIRISSGQEETEVLLSALTQALDTAS